MRSSLYFLLSLGLGLGVAACHPKPMDDMILADVALRAAQKVKAESLAPDAYRKAENFYLRAKKDFNEGYFESAKKFANEARLMAEQAEYQSLVKQTELKGGFVPETEESLPNDNQESEDEE